MFAVPTPHRRIAGITSTGLRAIILVNNATSLAQFVPGDNFIGNVRDLPANSRPFGMVMRNILAQRTPQRTGSALARSLAELADALRLDLGKG